MEGLITIKSKGKIIYQSDIWTMTLLIQHWGNGIQSIHIDQIFIDGKEIHKPEKMENDE